MFSSIPDNSLLTQNKRLNGDWRLDHTGNDHVGAILCGKLNLLWWVRATPIVPLQEVFFLIKGLPSVGASASATEYDETR